jgi:hypothetical protein
MSQDYSTGPREDDPALTTLLKEALEDQRAGSSIWTIGGEHRSGGGARMAA